MKKIPLLQLLCSRDPRTARKEHYARILCGEIRVDGERVRDPGFLVEEQAALTRSECQRFVSRGGIKLDGALEQWRLPVRGLSFIDAGASSGGFSDCLLQRGAARICAVETGYNQLDFRLRRDPRVVVLERTNLMSLEPKDLPFLPQAAVADLSLRSLRKAACHLLGLVSAGWLIALIKPQYEWLNPPAEFRGVVSADARQLEILKRLACDLEGEGVYVARAAVSLLPGRKGNREFFFLLSREQRRRGGDLDGLLRAALAQRQT